MTVTIQINNERRELTGAEAVAWIDSTRDTPEEKRMTLLKEFERAIEAHVDATARERGYRSADSIAGYATSTHDPWAAEAQAFVKWRDQVWVYAFAEMSKVQVGEREQPSVSDLLAGLPVIAWPD